MSALDDLLLKTYGSPKSDSTDTSDAPTSNRTVREPVESSSDAYTLRVRAVHEEPLASLSPQAVSHVVRLSTATAETPEAPTAKPDVGPIAPTSTVRVARVDDDLLQHRRTAPADETQAPVDPPMPTSLPIETEEEVSAPTPPPRRFQVDWEVDSFFWPAICDDFKQQVAAELRDAVAKIAELYRRQSLGGIVLTSARSNVGRTSLTLSLARELSGPSRSVAIVDLDHEHPTLMESLGVVVDQGLESINGKTCVAENICVRSLEDNVTLVPLTTAIPAAHCLYGEVQNLLRQLSGQHDIVLLDASPEVAELLTRYSGQVDYGAVIVNDQRVEQPQDQLREIIDRLKSSTAHAVGVIENFAA